MSSRSRGLLLGSHFLADVQIVHFARLIRGQLHHLHLPLLSERLGEDESAANKLHSNTKNHAPASKLRSDGVRNSWAEESGTT